MLAGWLLVVLQGMGISPPPLITLSSHSHLPHNMKDLAWPYVRSPHLTADGKGEV